MYGSGMVTGNNFVDVVTVAGLTSANQGLISLTQASGFSTSNADGLFRMAFTAIAEIKFTTFENLIKQGKVKTKEVSFYLGRAASVAAANSELTLGGRDLSKFTGPVTQAPVMTQG